MSIAPQQSTTLSVRPVESVRQFVARQYGVTITDEHAQAIAQLCADKQLRALANLSAQVAHDIRSPLTALRMMTAKLDGVPKEIRAVFEAAVSSINKIAERLVVQGSAARVTVSGEAEHQV